MPYNKPAGLELVCTLLLRHATSPAWRLSQMARHPTCNIGKIMLTKRRGSPNLTRQANTDYSLRRPPPQANMGAGIV